MQELFFDIEHVPGVKNFVPDALSRRPDHLPAIHKMSLQDPEFRQRIQDGYNSEEFSCKLIEALTNNNSSTIDKKIAKIKDKFKYENGFLYWTGTPHVRTYVPDHGDLRHEIIKSFHEPGGFGKNKTFNSCSQYVYWPSLYDDIAAFVKTCHDCQINKTPNALPAGKLQPLHIPEGCWVTITADFVTEFPTSSNSFDTVLVVVDKLSKRAIFIPTKKTVTAPEVFQLFQDHVFAKHGVPIKIVSDRDPKFISHYWKCLTELLDIKSNTSTADHPQTDGQSKIMIRILSNMLRNSIQKIPHEWDSALSEMEFEYNCSKNGSTGLSPFEVDIGSIPHKPATRSFSSCRIQCQSSAEKAEQLRDY